MPETRDFHIVSFEDVKGNGFEAVENVGHFAFGNAVGAQFENHIGTPKNKLTFIMNAS